MRVLITDRDPTAQFRKSLSNKGTTLTIDFMTKNAQSLEAEIPQYICPEISFFVHLIDISNLYIEHLTE